MALRRLLSKLNKKEGALNFNKDLANSTFYNSFPEMKMSKTIFYDNPFSNPISFEFSSKEIALLSDQFINRINEYQEQ